MMYATVWRAPGGRWHVFETLWPSRAMAETKAATIKASNPGYKTKAIYIGDCADWEN